MKPILVAFLLIVAAACSTTQLYTPGEKNVNKVEPATLAELQQGHDLYMNNCGKCHKLPGISKHTNQQWKGILDRMIPKAELNNEQSYLIFRYIVNR